MPDTQQIELARIDWSASEQRFCLRIGRGADGLRESLRASGQIAPLMLRQAQAGRLHLVCGFGRFGAMGALRWRLAATRLLRV